MCDMHLLLVYANLDQGYWARYQTGGFKSDERHAQRLADEQAKRAATAARVGVVYYVEVGSHIKIGWTSDLAKRMRSYPPNSRLLACHPGLRTDERDIHRKFVLWRSHGAEWYVLAPILLDHIKRVVAEHGQPDVVNFGAKPVQVPRPHQLNGSPQLRARSKISGFRRTG